jgi:ABC-type amino acid transport substrate-binding protein
MKTRILAGAAIALLLGSAARGAAADLPEIKARGALRVLAVIEDHDPEFLSIAPGREPGFDREVLEAFSRSQGLKLEIVPVASWDLLVGSVVAGKGDLIGGRVSDTAARRQHIDFTAEVFPTRVVVFNRRPAAPILSLAALSGQTIGTIKGTSMLEALLAAGIPETKIDTDVPATGSLADAVAAGKMTVGVWSIEGAILAQQRDPAVQIGMFLGAPQSLAYGLPRTAPLLRAALNEHIRLLKRTGTWNRLVIKYFGTSAPEILKRAREAASAS